MTIISVTLPVSAERENLATWNSLIVDDITGGNRVYATEGPQSETARMRFLTNDGANVMTLGFASGGVDRVGGMQGQDGRGGWTFDYLSAIGYSDIQITWGMRTTAAGHSDWQLQYRLNPSSPWVNAGEMARISNTGTLGAGDRTVTRTLPPTANGAETLEIRITPATPPRRGDGGTGNIGTGNSQINNIRISGMSGYTGGVPQPSIFVGSQVGQLMEGEVGQVTFSVSTILIDEGTPITLNNAPTGVTLDTATVAASGVTIVIVRTTAATPGGTHPLTLTAGGVTSAPFNLTVRPAPRAMTIAETKYYIPPTNNAPLGPIVIIRGTVMARTANNTLFIQDGTGENDGIAVFRSGTWDIGLVGREVEVTGPLGVFNGLPQIQPAEVSDLVDIGPGENFEPIDVTLFNVQAGAYMAMMVRVADIQLTTLASGSGLQNHRVAQFGADVILRVNAAQNLQGFSEGDWITIPRGFVSSFTTGPQLIMLTDDNVIAGEEPEERDTDNMAEWVLSAQTGISGTSIPATGGTRVNETSVLRKMVNGSQRHLIFQSLGAALDSQPSGNASLSGHANNAWWEVNISSLGFEDIIITWNMRSSAAGPRDYRLQYSYDRETWHDAVSPSVALGNNIAISDPRSEFTRLLPSSANNRENLYIRWLMSSNYQANGGTGPGGANNINNIVISGTYILGENQLRPVVVTPGSGSVGIGRVITFAPHPEDVYAENWNAEYSYDGIYWYSAQYNQYIITTLPTTIFVRGLAANMDASRISTHEFTRGRAPLVLTCQRPGTVVRLDSTLLLSSSLDGADIIYTINGGDERVFSSPIVFAYEIFTCEHRTVNITAWAAKYGYYDGLPLTFTFTKEQPGEKRILFGDLHAHSTLSDGAVSAEQAFATARAAGYDFFALTDHSNWFRLAPDSNSVFDPTHDIESNRINPATVHIDEFGANVTRWTMGLAATDEAYEPNEFVSMFGYEMTWSGNHPGHMNTFATGGWICRHNIYLSNMRGDAGLLAYYEMLERAPNSISMFNHPGFFFGTFNNFAYVNPIIRQRIALIEVGNGPGINGGGGYSRAFNYFNMALDRGWHVAPSMNEDNHGANFGASPIRTAVLTNDFTREGIYSAIRARRVYATEVEGLQIRFYANGEPLGTVFDTVPNMIEFEADIYSPTDRYEIISVAIITNGGQEILELTSTPHARYYEFREMFETPHAGWYYLRVLLRRLQGGAIRYALTAPVWLGEGRRAGISELSIDTYLPVTTEALTLSAYLFNDEAVAATLESITYYVNGSPIANYTLDSVISAGETYTHSRTHIPQASGQETIEAAAMFRFADGHTQLFRQSLTYNVTDINQVVYIGIDGSHYNEFVSGYYSNQMEIFARMAAQEGVRVQILRTHEELIAATANPRFGALIMTPPSRRLYQDVNQYQTYSDEVLQAVGNFVRNGNIVVVTGMSNLYENFDGLIEMPQDEHMAAQQNKLLAAIGSTLRMSDDAAADTLQNEYGDIFRLQLTDQYGSFNWASPLLSGVDRQQVYTQFNGSTVHMVAYADRDRWDALPAASVPNGVTPVIMLSASGGESQNREPLHGANTNYRTDYTRFNGQIMVLAHETIEFSNGNEAFIIAAGGAFMNDFEVMAELDNAGDLQVANYNIAMNLIRMVTREPVPEILSVSPNPANGTVVVSFVHPRTPGVVLIVAAYSDEKGQYTSLQEVAIHEIMLDDENSVIIPITLSRATKIKVMMWESMTTMRPLCVPYETLLS